MTFSRLPRKDMPSAPISPSRSSAKKLERILEAGRIAPTAKNNQPHKFLVVQRTEGLEKLSKCTNVQGYPLAIIVCGVPSEAWVRPYDGKGMVDTDTAIVATHMLLEAADLGLGSCWMTRFDPSVVRELFRIPEGIEPEHILSIGYAAENAHPSERHTSRKPLADLVVEESF